MCEVVSEEMGARRPPLPTAVVCPPGRRRRLRLAITADPGNLRRQTVTFTCPTPFDRGRPASDPSAAARAEAEPMGRSAASQLATVTRCSLQPPSCPLSERCHSALVLELTVCATVLHETLRVGICNYGGLIDTLFTDVEGVA